MGEAGGRRPNALLSAYYKNDEMEVVGGDGGEREVPDGGKAAAHKYAAELIQTLPLSRLLVCSTQLRKEAREVEAGLHRIVQESYTKFQATAGVVGDISTHTGKMEGDLVDILKTVENVAEGTQKVNARLAEGRERVEQLEGARRVLQLMRAAKHLPARMRELHSQGKTADAAKRYSLILPSISRLENIHAYFQEARSEIDAAAIEIREQIAAKMSSGEGIDPGKAVNLRVQLGESPALMKEAFLQSSTAIVTSNAPTVQPGFQGASTCLNFFSETIVPRIIESAESFQKMFPEEPDLFASWVGHVLESAIITPACSSLSMNKDKIDFRWVNDLVDNVRVARGAASKVLQDERVGTILTSLPSLLERACTAVLREAHTAIYKQLEIQLVAIAREVLTKKRSVLTLLSEYSAAIGLSTDCSNATVKAIGASEQGLLTGDISTVAEHVIKELWSLMNRKETEGPSSEILMGAIICATLEKEPRFRKAKPMSLCPKLIREYAVRSAARMAEPMREATYVKSSAASDQGHAVGKIMSEILEEVSELADRTGAVANSQQPERRVTSRRSALITDDLGSLSIGLVTNIDLNRLSTVREVLSCFFRSWVEFLRDTEIAEGSEHQIQANCLLIKETILSSFPGSEQGLNEAIKEILSTAKRRMRT